MLKYKPDLRSVCLDNCRCYRELRLCPCRRWCRTRCRKCPRHRRPDEKIVGDVFNFKVTVYTTAICTQFFTMCLNKITLEHHQSANRYRPIYRLPILPLVFINDDLE